MEYTYPEEISLTEAEKENIKAVRVLIGDVRELNRSYVNSREDEGLFADGLSYVLSDKGWPVRIFLGGIEYTDLLNPRVLGYRYVTFSGSLNPISDHLPLDIWWESFDFSDVEINDVLDNVVFPQDFPSDKISDDFKVLKAGIDLLSEELKEASKEALSVRDGDTAIDTSRSLEVRRRLLDDLRIKWERETTRVMLLGINGWRVE